MMRGFFLVLLVSVLSSTALSLWIPHSSVVSVMGSTSVAPDLRGASNASNSQVHCFGTKLPFTRQKPRFSDCGLAIRKLPSNHIIGTFRHGGTIDQFRLPFTTVAGTCKVNVDLWGGVTRETSTWLGIGAAATQLNMACVSRSSLPVRVGGWTTAGSDERIRVTLLYFHAPDKGGNVTIAR